MALRTDEMETFKIEIDFVSFAPDHGHEVEPRKRYRASVAMKAGARNQCDRRVFARRRAIIIVPAS